VPDVAGVSLRQHEIFDQGRRSQAGQRGRREHGRLDYQRAEQGDRQHLEVWFSLWRHVKGRLAWRVVRPRSARYPKPLTIRRRISEPCAALAFTLVHVRCRGDTVAKVF